MKIFADNTMWVSLIFFFFFLYIFSHGYDRCFMYVVYLWMDLHGIMRILAWNIMWVSFIFCWVCVFLHGHVHC